MVRNYPSEQNTNLNTIGSLVYTYTEYLEYAGNNHVEFYVNSNLREVAHNEVEGKYSTDLNVGDVVTVNFITDDLNSTQNWTIIRRDYKTDDTNGNLGIIDTYISSGATYSTGTTFTFTATTLNDDYNFEYRLTLNLTTPSTPTPTPTPTPNPICGANNVIVHRIGVQTDGKIVVGGSFTQFDSYNLSGIVKLNSNGIPFSGFTPNPNSVSVSDSLLLDNEYIITLSNSNAFRRWSPTGTFDLGGAVSGTTLWSLAKSTSSKFYTVGENIVDNYTTGMTPNNIIRYTSGLTVDNTFTPISISGSSISAYEQTDGKVLVAGKYTGMTAGYSSIIRINNDGSLDTGFSYNNNLALVYDIKQHTDNKIYYGGYSVGILNSDGTNYLNPYSLYFNEGGTLANCVAVQTDGKFIIGGTFTTYKGTSVGYIVRINTDGTLDNTFNGGGAGFNGIVTDVKILSDGKMIVVGSFTTYNNRQYLRIVKLNVDGTVDDTFLPYCPTHFIPTPTPTSTPTPTATPTVTPTSTPTVTPTPTSTPTVTPTPTPTGGPTFTPTPTPVPDLPNIITSGLTIYVDGSGSSYPSFGSTWYNRVSGGPNGTINGSPTWTASTGGYFTFDGVNDYIDFGQSSTGSTTQSATFGGWVNMTTGSTKELIFIRGGSQYNLQLYKDTDNKFKFQIVFSPNTVVTCAGTTTITNNTWYYVVAKWTRNNGLRIYLNGSLETTVSNTSLTLRDTSTVGWFIGLDGTDYDVSKVGDFEVYNRSLSDAEITSNFDAKKSIYGY